MVQETTFTNTHKLQGGATAIATADLDDDGDIDVLSTSYTSNSIIWHVNDAEVALPLFTPSMTLSINHLLSLQPILMEMGIWM